jgi:hypothetical protein
MGQDEKLRRIESGVQIYAIGLLGPERYGYSVLRSISALTDGRSFSPSFFGGDLAYYLNLIRAELRTQYLLGD